MIILGQSIRRAAWAATLLGAVILPGSLHAQTQPALTDCVYTTKLWGRSAYLTVEGGKPAHYKWRRFSTANVWWEKSDTIRVFKARLKIMERREGAFLGYWHYNGHVRKSWWSCM